MEIFILQNDNKASHYFIIRIEKYQEGDDFTFVFCEEKFKMKNLFAEFISTFS